MHKKLTSHSVCYLRFADDIDLLLGSEDFQRLTARLEKTAAGYGMEISSHKSKILVNSIQPRPCTNIWVTGKTLEEVNQFQYLCRIHTNQRRNINKVSKGQTGTSTLSNRKASNTMENNAISFPIKIKLYKSLVLPMLLYGCNG